MRVFISHSSADKPAVLALAEALHAAGLDVWLDKWEISAGDDIVTSINDGLEEADAGIVVFSEHSRGSRWVEAEVSFLTYVRIQEGRLLIPVIVGESAYVPPLLRPLARRRIDETDAIIDRLRGHIAKPPTVRRPEAGDVVRTVIAVVRDGDSGLRVSLRIGDAAPTAEWSVAYGAFPRTLAAAQMAFLQGMRAGVRRTPDDVVRQELDSVVVTLGRELRGLCLPGDIGAALTNLVDGSGVGTTVEVVFEADHPRLLGLPFEALRLPDDRVLATQPNVVVMRRPVGLAATAREPMAAPLKILVAVGAPDEGPSAGAVLDQERELQNILDAVEPAQRLENFEVRILEVGHPDVIADAARADAYHVLHLSCHGLPGALQLEDEDGHAVLVDAAGLLDPIRESGRPLPLVLLNACHGGVDDRQTASLAEELLRGGVPAVLAMQTSVSDVYATRLAYEFYRSLADREQMLPSRALADARRALERERQAAIGRGAGIEESQPEYATASLFVAGEERPLADFTLDKVPLRVRPVHMLEGPVPQLSIGDLIGRRRELRDALRVLRDGSGQRKGVVFTGIGGVGKSAVAGRAMQRLSEDGWLVAAHVGRLGLAPVAQALGGALILTPSRQMKEVGQRLLTADASDPERLSLLATVLAQAPIVLVLDDFEQNLASGGGAFADGDLMALFAFIVSNCRRSRLLVTCRYPVSGHDVDLHRIPIGPLSAAETRKLLQRLPALRGVPTAELAAALKSIGRHPRMLEFLDALLRADGQGRLPHVTTKLRAVLAQSGIDPQQLPASTDERVQAALLAGSRDVFLDELLAIARRDGADEVLLQVAVSNLPVEPAGVARMMADDPADEGDIAAVDTNLERLVDLSLIHRFPDRSVWVHRWTAAGLRLLAAGSDERHAVRCRRAAAYRMWRVDHESKSVDDGVEGLRNFLAAGASDEAVAVAGGLFSYFERSHQSMATAAVASEVVDALPESHPAFASVADRQAQALLALGMTNEAHGTYVRLLQRFERLAAAEPDRADYQRDLSVSYERMGDLYRALGQGEQARDAYGKSLAIRERLAAAEPDRADYQIDLVHSLWRLAAADREGGGSLLVRGREILLAMRQRGALTPADEGMIEWIEGLISEHGKA
ncbi:MAG: CHAT domain-containing protein [Ardenticatenales bacterium]|nr:CHAT domain-containing protein [Ardenticatenales bacterium]